VALREVEDLRAGYGELPVLQGISFTVDEGHTCVLLGLNGAGKTTTVANLVGLYKPWKGSVVRFEDEDVTGHAPADLVKRGIVMVPEGRRTFPQMSVVQNLRLGAWVRRNDKAGVEETMERVFEYFPRLEERRDQLAGSMSGGEQQMLAIGRGMMADPRLLIIDEASLGLSPLLAKTVFQVVDRIKDDGVTVILVEQNVGALRHADKAIVMEKGELVYQGHGDEIRDSARLRETYLGAPA
jgi:branched-chain amino acid transport system ATP-binding protein